MHAASSQAAAEKGSTTTSARTEYPVVGCHSDFEVQMARASIEMTQVISTFLLILKRLTSPPVIMCAHER